MIPVLFDPDQHLEHVNRWLVGHKQAPMPRDMVPRFGFVVEGVAACFLWRTDSSVVFLDGYVTNPEASLRARAKACDAISIAAVETAKRIGGKVVVALCSTRSTVALSKKHGFTIGSTLTAAIRKV